VRRVVTSRRGGRSQAPYDTFNLGTHVGDVAETVADNRRRLADELDMDGGSLAWMNQVHGDRVTMIGSVPPVEPPTCDGLVTATPGVVLVVLVADCVPVLLADQEAGVVGVAHAGRQGLRRKVVARTVDAMLALGADPATIDVLLGPAICGGCYEVSAELRDQVEAQAPGGAGRSRTGAPSLDLRDALAVQLGGLGIQRVVSDPRCTMEDPMLYSYRRDGVTGRQAGVIWLT